MRREGGGHWRLLEPGGIRSGLAAELSEIEVRAGAIAEVHRFVEAAFGVVAVEDDAVDGDGDDFDDDLDQGANEGPALSTTISRCPQLDPNVQRAYLHPTDECVVDVFAKNLLPPAVFAGPAPHIFVFAVSLLLIQYPSPYSPHDDTEHEESNGEDCVIHRGFLGSSMPTLPIRIQDANGHYQGDGCNAEESDLRPNLLLRGPSWHFLPIGQMPGRIKDGKCGGKHRHDD